MSASKNTGADEPRKLLCRAGSVDSSLISDKSFDFSCLGMNTSRSKSGDMGFEAMSEPRFVFKRTDSGDMGGERSKHNPITQGSGKYYQSKAFADSSNFKFEFS
eukprot:gene7843-1048_t